MRKLLLATAAVVGGTLSLANVAGAQLLQTTPPGPPNPVPSPPSPFTSTPSVGGLPAASPGTITVRLNARVLVYAAAGSDSGRTGNPVTPVAPTITGGALSLGAPQTNTKLAPFSFFEYARMYPGFDGIAANGLKYGASLEIRQDTGAPPGGGINGGVSASSRARAQLYFRRETAYVGADNYGFLRYGATDQPTSLFMTGSSENFNDGGWNGDLPGFFTGGTQVVWPFPDVGNLYTTSKLVYLSPKFFDMVDFGVSYEPNTGTLNAGPGNCPYGVTANAGVSGSNVVGQGLGCDAASSTSSGDYTRRRNTLDAVIRLRTAAGPVGINATIGGFVSGKVLDNATPARAVQYDGMGVYDAGLALVYGGLTVGAHVTGGATNNQFSLKPQGTPNAIAYTVGASYAIGPMIFGASWLSSWSAGSQTSVNQNYVGGRVEQGAAAGVSYSFAPGAVIFLSYLYGQRRQNGVDLLSGASSNATNTVLTNNKTRAQGVLFGTFFRW